MNMADAMKRAQVLDVGLQQQLTPHMQSMKPRPSVYYPDFIAANQSDRADNVIGGSSKWGHLEHLRSDIRDFKASKQLDTVSCNYFSLSFRGKLLGPAFITFGDVDPVGTSEQPQSVVERNFSLHINFVKYCQSAEAQVNVEICTTGVVVD